MSEYNIQMNKYNALNAEYDQLYPQPMNHASTHAKDGDDPITPSSIGAAELGTDGKVLASQIPSIEVDAYTKVQTLSDTTKTLFGLDATAVPDDAFNVLSRFHKGLGNEYVWAKIDNIVTEGATNSRSGPLNVVEWGEHGTGTVLSGNVALIADTLKDALTGNYTSVKVSDYASSIDTMISALQTMLPGKFFYCSNSFNPPAWVYCPIDVTVAKASGVSYYIQVSGSMTSYDNAKLIKSVVGYVNSPDPNAYPIDDGYTYAALGQLGNKAQIATGSYIGTGKYDTGNKNVISLPFDPKLVIVGKKDYGLTPQSSGGSNGGWLESFLWYIGLEKARSYRASSNNYGFVYFTNTTSSFTWYSSETVEMQCNVSGTTYYYIAIG